MRNRHIPHHSRRDRQTSASLPWPFLTRGLSPAPCPPEVTPPSSLPHAEHGAKNGARSTSTGPHGMWNKRKKKVKEPQYGQPLRYTDWKSELPAPHPCAVGRGDRVSPLYHPRRGGRSLSDTRAAREGRTRPCPGHPHPPSLSTSHPLQSVPRAASPLPAPPCQPTVPSPPTQGVPWRTRSCWHNHLTGKDSGPDDSTSWWDFGLKDSSGARQRDSETEAETTSPQLSPPGPSLLVKLSGWGSCVGASQHPQTRVQQEQWTVGAEWGENQFLHPKHTREMKEQSLKCL